MNGASHRHVEQVLNEVRDRSCFVVGGSATDREEILAGVAKALSQRKDQKVFSLPSGLKSGERYLRAVQALFPLTSPLGKAKGAELSLDQVNDVQLDWTNDYRSVVILIPEIGKLLEKEPAAFFQIVSQYFSKMVEAETAKGSQQRTLRVVMSVPHEIPEWEHRMELFFGTASPVDVPAEARKRFHVVALG